MARPRCIVWDRFREVPQTPLHIESIERVPLASVDVAGRFVVRRRLGRGTGGEVWQAWDRGTKRLVAVKSLHAGAAVDEDLIWEANAAAGVHHPNLARLLVLGTAGASRLLLFEYIDGMTLRDVATAGGPLVPSDGVHIMLPVARALGALHGAGFVHGSPRDENIMVERSGRIVLLDFGLAARVGVPHDQPSGRPMYWEPEAARAKVAGQPYTPFPPRDVFAAGMTLAKCILGPGGVPSRELTRGFSDSQLWTMLSPESGIEAGLADILRRAMSGRMIRRQRDGAELADDLAQWLESE